MSDKKNEPDIIYTNRGLYEEAGEDGIAGKKDVVREALPAYLLDQSEDDARAARAREILKLDRQGQYTVEDYYALPDDRRFELIDGVLIEMFSPVKLHQAILRELVFQIYKCIEKSGADCELFFAPSDVQLDRDERTMVQPDLYVVCHTGQYGGRAFRGEPDFVIEVLSESNRAHDLVRKLNKYRAAGVREYWIVDPKNRSVRVYHFEAGTPEVLYRFDDTVEIRISGGDCAVDFEKISRKVAHHY